MLSVGFSFTEDFPLGDLYLGFVCFSQRVIKRESRLSNPSKRRRFVKAVLFSGSSPLSQVTPETSKSLNL